MNKLSKNLLMGIAGLGVALSALAMSPGGRGDCDYTGPRYEPNGRSKTRRATPGLVLHDQGSSVSGATGSAACAKNISAGAGPQFKNKRMSPEEFGS